MEGQDEVVENAAAPGVADTRPYPSASAAVSLSPQTASSGVEGVRGEPVDGGAATKPHDASAGVVVDTVSDGGIYQRLIQGIAEYAIYMLDTEGRIRTWNAGAQRAKGYTAEEIIGCYYGCLYTPEDQVNGLPASNLRIARDEGKFQAEGWRARKDGSKFWAHAVIDPIYDANGALFGFANVTRDCTELHHLLIRAQEQEQRFRLLAEGITDYAIYMLDPSGIVTSWNAGAERANGYEAAEIVGEHFSMFYTPEDQAKGIPALGIDTARHVGKFDAEGWRVRKDGSHFWAHVVIQPVYDDDDALFGFAKITRDCSEQRKNANALAATSQNLNLALTNMRQGLCLFNQRGELVLSNRRFSDIFELPPDALTAGMSLETVVERISQIVPLWEQPEAAEHLRQLTVSLSDRDSWIRETMELELLFRLRHIAVSTRMLAHGGWVSTVEDVTEQRMTEQRIQHLAHHDTLTNLPNRTSFQNRIHHLLNATGVERAGFALLYLDLDRFKPVNDSLGHHIGDLLLKAVSQRLLNILGTGEQLARLGGDEFTIVTTSCRTVAQARALAQRCIDQLDHPFEIASNEISIGVSVGVVLHADNATDADHLLQQADLALYKAKREGRNRFCLYEPGMSDPLRTRNEIEDDLRRALRGDELTLHYQPIIDAVTGRVTACEALLRWRHRRRGVMAPAQFIPVAEERGMMHELGAWVMKRACMDAMAWPEDVRLSLNVSPSQLLYHEFIGALSIALEESRFPACRLELEITETALLENAEIPRQILKEVRAMGIGVAMDDFGTGYSSLSLLQSFPFTRIKVDRSFIKELGRNPKSMAIVRSVMSLCRSLGMATIAEGVETQAQRETLLAEHCTELQGFLVCRPMPPADVLRWLNAVRVPGHGDATSGKRGFTA